MIDINLIEYYKSMDVILSYMSTVPDAIPMLPVEIAKRAGVDVENPIAYMMCAKMSREGYLQRFDGVKYALMAEGLFFAKTGGYEKLILNENLENARLDKLEKQSKANQMALFWLTLVVALATFVQAVYCLTELYWKYGWFRY